MKYHDAEVSIQDVNSRNAEIFEKGWTYVTSTGDKSAPLYFAPYFTKENPNSGISMMSRVLHTEVVVLPGDPVPFIDPSKAKHSERWKCGLEMIKERARNEKWKSAERRLLYLDEPMVIATTPITKRCFNTTDSPKKFNSQIAKGFHLRFDELLRYGLGFGSS